MNRYETAIILQLFVISESAMTIYSASIMTQIFLRNQKHKTYLLTIIVLRQYFTMSPNLIFIPKYS